MTLKELKEALNKIPSEYENREARIYDSEYGDSAILFVELEHDRNGHPIILLTP